MLRVKYQIEGEKPDVHKILANIKTEDFSIYEDEGILFLTVVVKDIAIMNELLRRLRPKKCRQNTKVSIIEKQAMPGSDLCRQKFQFNHLGYRTRIQRRGYSYFVGLNKMVVVGHNINKGKELYAYLAQDTLGRGMLVVYLDGNPKNNPAETQSVDNNSFLET